MRTIKELLDLKGPATIHSIAPDGSVFEAVTCMVENNIGAILVLVDGSIKGIMTERDYLRFITGRGRTARDTPVSELMTSKVIFLTPDTSLDEAMAIMTEARIRHIPILDGGSLLGIVSIGDLVKQISSNREVQLRNLEDYINDPYPGPGTRKS